MKKILIINVLLFLLIFPFCSQAIDFQSGTNNAPTALPNPLGENATDPNVIVGKVIAAILGIVGSLALLMFVYGGLVWMLAAGNKENVTKGKDILVWATIGMAVIFSAYAFIKFILQGFGVG